MPIFFFFLILFSFSAAAETNYSQFGTEDQDFRLSGPGFWNSGRSDTCGSGGVTCQTRNIGSPGLMPLVEDLDGDGINEIVIFDGLNVRLYHNSDLEIIDAFTSSVTITGGILFDIDNDSMIEVIISGVNDLEILEYNGTHFFSQILFENNLSGYETGSGNHLIGCNDFESCVVFYEEREDGVVPNSGAIEFATFNSTNIVHESELAQSINNNVLCLSSITSMPLVDYDNDGDEEFILSFTDSGNNNVRIFWVFLNESLNIVSEGSASETALLNIAGWDCVGTTGGNMANVFTSPLTFDIDGSSSNGLETVIGLMISADDFKMHSYTGTRVFLDDYPEITNGEGILISNVFRANIFSDTDSEDFCVFGYENVAEELNMVCASEQTGEVVETVEFEFDTTGFVFNVSSGYHLVTHSTQQTSILTDGNNLDEIINSYGVFELDFVLINELILIWENPQGDSVLYPLDVEKIGADDLLALTATNIWYIDDGFSNSNAEISRYTTDPSIQSVIQINETPQVTITCTDIDGDSVQARLISYLGEANEQDTNFSVLSGSGSVFPFSFEANQTTASSNLRISCRDSEHNISDNITVPFSVSNVGSQVGDSFFDSGELLEEVDEDVAGAEPNISSNAIRNTIEDIDDVANTNLGNGVIWLLIMAVVAYIIWTSDIAGKDPMTAFGVIAIVEVILLMIGIRLQFLSMIYLFVVIIIALAVLAIKFRKELTGG